MVASTTSTIVSRLAAAVDLIADIDPPDGVTVGVEDDGRIDLHPITEQDRRIILGARVFADATWTWDTDGIHQVRIGRFDVSVHPVVDGTVPA